MAQSAAHYGIAGPVPVNDKSPTSWLVGDRQTTILPINIQYMTPKMGTSDSIWFHVTFFDEITGIFRLPLAHIPCAMHSPTNNAA